MNPITFNERFGRAMAAHPEKLEQLFGNWRVAPLFDYETTFDKEMQLTPEGTGFGDLASNPWPFETFRLSLMERDVPADQRDPLTDKADYLTHYVVSRRDGRVYIMIYWCELSLDIIAACRGIGADDEGDAHIYRVGKGWVTDKLRLRADGGIEVMIGSSMGALGAFLEDVMMPSYHMAEVRPCRGNHSVHWQKARTHYTFITHGHPANRKDVPAGARVASSQLEELKRAAHNRKAHKRTLRAARFTYARGKTIDVKASWVGPKEWMDEGGRQIYRILEPVDGPQLYLKNN